MEAEAIPWEKLCVDLRGPYHIKNKTTFCNFHKPQTSRKTSHRFLYGSTVSPMYGLVGEATMNGSNLPSSLSWKQSFLPANQMGNIVHMPHCRSSKKEFQKCNAPHQKHTKTVPMDFCDKHGSTILHLP